MANLFKYCSTCYELFDKAVLKVDGLTRIIVHGECAHKELMVK